MVLVAFSVDFFAVGFFFYSYGAFFNAIAKDFEIGAFGASLVFTCVHGVGAICAPLVGRALDRYPVRLVMAIGAISMGTGFLLLSQVNNVYQLYLVISLFIGFGASSMGNLATSKLVTNWFVTRRGMALGIAASGVSLSGLIMPNVSAQLIENYGWQTGFALFGFFTLFVVLPLIIRLVITRPEDVGFLPDGEPQDLKNIQQTRQERAIGFREVLRLPNFWIIVVTFALLFCSMSATLTHMIPRVEYLGYGLVFSAAVASLCAGAGFPGKLFFGWVSDKANQALHDLCYCGSIRRSAANVFIRDDGAVCCRSNYIWLWSWRGRSDARGYCWKDFWQIEFWICSRHYATGDVSDSDSRCSLCRFGF